MKVIAQLMKVIDQVMMAKLRVHMKKILRENMIIMKKKQENLPLANFVLLFSMISKLVAST